MFFSDKIKATAYQCILPTVKKGYGSISGHVKSNVKCSSPTQEDGWHFEFITSANKGRGAKNLAHYKEPPTVDLASILIGLLTLSDSICNPVGTLLRLHSLTKGE